jgi:hypothetical protein
LSPITWLQYVNEPQTEAEVERLRECIRRRRPYGTDNGTRKTAAKRVLGASLRPPGRPPKKAVQGKTLFGEEQGAE